MKLYTAILHAIKRITGQQPSAVTSQTEIEHHIAEGCAKECVATPDSASVIPNPVKVEQPGMVTMRFTFAGENERYLKVKVQGKIFQLAKSRVTYILSGIEVVVTMTSKYAASRQALVGLQLPRCHSSPHQVCWALFLPPEHLRYWSLQKTKISSTFPASQLTPVSLNICVSLWLKAARKPTEVICSISLRGVEPSPLPQRH